MRKIKIIGAVITFLILMSSCGEDKGVDLRIGNDVYTVEIARTVDEQKEGLMFRKELPEFHGMIFVYNEDRKLSFWMKNTLVPLSIAYIARDGTIKEIHNMEPGSLDPVRSEHSVRYALELNQGAFARSGAGVGDVIDLSGLPEEN